MFISSRKVEIKVRLIVVGDLHSKKTIQNVVRIMFQVLMYLSEIELSCLKFVFKVHWNMIQNGYQKEGLIYFHLNILGIEEILLCMKTKVYRNLHLFWTHFWNFFMLIKYLYLKSKLVAISWTSKILVPWLFKTKVI